MSAKTSDKNLVEAKVEGASGKLSASLGDAKIEAKGTTGSSKVEVDKNLNVKTSSEGAKARSAKSVPYEKLRKCL